MEKKKKRKNETDQHDEDQQQTEKDLRLATWNVRSLYRPGDFRITINELRKNKIAIAAIQETRWNKLTPQAFTSNSYNIYTSSLANNHELEKLF
jgi:hypothetical protein